MSEILTTPLRDHWFVGALIALLMVVTAIDLVLYPVWLQIVQLFDSVFDVEDRMPPDEAGS